MSAVITTLFSEKNYFRNPDKILNFNHCLPHSKFSYFIFSICLYLHALYFAKIGTIKRQKKEHLCFYGWGYLRKNGLLLKIICYSVDYCPVAPVLVCYNTVPVAYGLHYRTVHGSLVRGWGLKHTHTHRDREMGYSWIPQECPLHCLLRQLI